MPRPQFKYLKDSALLWAKTGYGGNGQPVCAVVPVELSPENRPPNGLRLVLKRRVVLDPQGNTIALDASAVVTQDIAVGSRLWFGTYTDWVGTGSGLANVDEEMMECVWQQKIPDIKGRSHYREIGLIRKANKAAQ